MVKVFFRKQFMNCSSGYFISLQPIITQAIKFNGSETGYDFNAS